MRKTIGTSFLLFASYFAMAQHSFHGSIDFGVSDLVVERDANFAFLSNNKLNNRYNASHAMELGYGYSWKSLRFETGLRYSVINSWQEETISYNSFNGQFSMPIQVTDEITRKAQYLQVPLSVNYKYQNIQIGVGMYAAYMASNSYWSEMHAEDGFIFSSGSGNDLKRFDYGYLAKLGIDVNDRFSIFLQATVGLPNVNSDAMRNNFEQFLQLPPEFGQVQDQLRVRQFTLGLRYNLSMNKLKNKNV